jgi:hypothetical protein
MNDALKEAIDREVAATARAEAAEHRILNLEAALVAAAERITYLEDHYKTAQHQAILAAVAAHQEKQGQEP